MVDYNALRAQTLGSGTDEEAVTVNTRALIDKVLARYSGEWTVLRELLQNAADASATRVAVKFETVPSSTVPLPQDQSTSNILKHTIQHHTLRRLVVSNNGQVFNENDWSRLKRIAEGNPDETKIGAFGVGFYSTFADCEEPFISSGREAMAFFWKNNSLFTRRLKLSEKDSSTDTTFVLDYRDTTSPVPALLPLAQFFASSLTFVGLENIQLSIDGYNILSLHKKMSPSMDIAIPRDVEPKTTEGFMKVASLTKQVAQIDGSWMSIVGYKPKTAPGRTVDRDSGPSLRKFFSRLAGTAPEEQTRPPSADGDESHGEGLAAKVSATVFLNVNTATIKTFTGQKFNEELERATKKPPPKYTKLAILTAPYIENDTVAQTKSAGDVFATVLPSRSGKIFIGFPTHQTTGLNAHISAPSVIPTVERESIDLNARYVRTWNMEMLRAVGIVSRIAWITEMSELREKIARLTQGQRKVRVEDVDPFLPEAITIFNNFTFRESTPSAKISQLLEDAFWTCGKKASIEVLSSCGVLFTHDVRMAPKDLSFMAGIPIIPERLLQEAKPLVDKLIDFGLLTEVTVSDIKKALEANALTAAQLSEFLRWLTSQASKGQLDRPTISNLLAVAVANDENADGTPSKVLVLGEKQHFLNASKTPVDMPVPSTVMPFKFTKSLSKSDLESIGWQELQMVPWIKWLIQASSDRNILTPDQDITGSKPFASQVLPLLSKQWDSLSQSSRTTLVELLTTQTVIPTKLGMKRPGESYFPNVKLFDDLPTIVGLNTVKDKFLVALGVRKTIELGVVFDRLLALDSKKQTDSKPKWSHVDLIQYLASVRDDIPSQDIQRLKNTPICLRTKHGDPDNNVKRYRVSELFEPRAEFRDLGLPALQWQGLYRGNSPEGRLLSLLGLRTVPSVEELIEIMARAGASGDLDLRDKALTFFLSHHHSNGYARFNYAAVQTPFLPLQRDSAQLAVPSRCFIDEGAALLGFDIIRRDWVPHAQKLGVALNPPILNCVQVLAQKPPRTHENARAVFGYFASRLGEIDGSLLPRLKTLAFIPIFSRSSEKSTHVTRFVAPQSCFLGESQTFGEIFDFVDFGNSANSFLLRCGSKLEPTKTEVAQILVKEPARISSTFRNPEQYLSLLRNMADSVAELKKDKELWREMKKAPFLLASKELATQKPVKHQGSARIDDLDDFEDEEAQGIREFQLCKAEDAIIVDDYINYNLFKASVLAAPQEETLEDFYFALGAPLLSTLVEEAARHGPRSSDQRPAQKLQKQIMERAKIFLHDQPPDSIKHDTKWLEKNLSVLLVPSISLRRSLKGRDLTHTEKRTAVVTQVNREYTLWIVGERPDLYQVSQSLVHLLLVRPKPHSALTLEMLLKSDLLELRARGFNVSRILRQKAAEARLAESKRQQQLEEERKRLEEEQKAWDAAHDQVALAKSQNGLPGGFPDSPDAKESKALAERPHIPVDDSEERRGSRNLLSNISRQFGLNNNRHIQSMFGQQPEQKQVTANDTQAGAPPPYSYNDNEKQPGQGPAPGSGVTAPHQLQQNLLGAIRKARPHTSNQLYSRGETNVVSETKSYCDEHPAHDLTGCAEIKHGIQMFLSPTDYPDAVRSSFLGQHAAGLQAFASLLRDVGNVFNIPANTLNIFHEVKGKTIAFNRQGSIFCNYHYFLELHEKQLASGDLNDYGTVFVYWWVILCHELAHNLVGDHSSNHSYYTEGFVSTYFGKVVTWLGEVAAKRAQPTTAPQDLLA
jgi:hypothetical protein